MWWTLGKMLLGGVMDSVKDRAAIRKAKVDSEIKVIQKASQNISDWEKIHAKGSQSSWKDEWWTLVWSIPLVMGFVPGGSAYTQAGFEALSKMPEWYQYTLVTMVLASFGIRINNVVQGQLKKFRS